MSEGQARNKEASVVKKIRIVFPVLFAVLALALPVLSGGLTGSIKGRITDKQGFPLPGAFLYIKSPAFQGMQNYITADKGNFAFTQLPPGTYKLTVEMPGFKTVNVEDIRLDMGKVLTVNVRLESSEIEEEITSVRTAPVIDSQSPGNVFIADSDLLRHAPLGRDFSAIVNLAPGVIRDENGPDGFFAINGSSVKANAFFFNGTDFTDPVSMKPLSKINVDLVEQVEYQTSARTAEFSPAEGGYIQVLTRSGGNRFLGELRLFHTSNALTKSLWSNSELAEKGLTAPADPASRWEVSLNLGGPIMEDRAWYFSNLRFGLRSQAALFEPWTDPLGTSHKAYDWKRRDLGGYFKLTSRAASNIRAIATILLDNEHQAVDEATAFLKTPESATRSLNNHLFQISGLIQYDLNQDTKVDFTLGMVQRSTPQGLASSTSSLPQYTDALTGMNWGSGSLNEKTTTRKMRAGASITRIQNGLMGITHELKAGADYESASNEQSTWKANNLALLYLDGSPYYYGTAASPTTGLSVGKGLVSFYIAGKEEGDLVQKTEMKRLGLYVQDSMTIAHRASLHLGLRFDRSTSRIASIGKGASGNALSVTLGKSLILPVAGINPYDATAVSEWDSVIAWNALSPRAGLSFDVFGNGRTMFKSSFARYSEYLNLDYIQSLSAFSPTRSHAFEWYDENGNGLVEATDSFALTAYDYRLYKEAYLKSRVDPDIKAPRTDELTFGLHQEVTKNFTVSLDYTIKNKKNILSNVLYDPDSGAVWYSAESVNESWWVPFRTTVPVTGDYAATPVTVYFKSNNAPDVFERLQNVAELRNKYNAVTLTLSKRMAGNWQFYGSVVWGRATGNTGLGATSAGFSASALTANSFVNLPLTARMDLDRPSAIKLVGTYKLPFTSYLTLSFKRFSGMPWARTVTIVPPAAWVEANNIQAEPVTVYLETPGARRTAFYQTVDMRLEKEFGLKNRKYLKIHADVFNLLGRRTNLMDLNDAGFWYPNAENSAAGARLLSSTFNKTIAAYGSRTIQLTLTLQF